MLFPILALLALLSAGLALWQWTVARRFPLRAPAPRADTSPPITLLKPLKGVDHETLPCLRSWLTQQYPAPLQVLFGVASASDPACDAVHSLLAEFPGIDAELLVCERDLGANAKVSTLIQLRERARHPVLLVSDADTRVEPGFLSQTVPFLDGAALVNCFYRLANAQTVAMRWEAVAINADFWSQVLQSRTLKPIDFALGAVMLFRAENLREIGGFEGLADYLADDYQLGHRMARHGRIALAHAVVDCHEPRMGWRAVWNHQLRWARTIRICQPGPFFCSILSNGTLWPLLLAAAVHTPASTIIAFASLSIRVVTACSSQARMEMNTASWKWCWMIPVKDLLGFAIWASAFAGNTVLWRGKAFRMTPGGRLVPLSG